MREKQNRSVVQSIYDKKWTSIKQIAIEFFSMVNGSFGRP
jgi:hypothetical protein